MAKKKEEAVSDNSLSDFDRMINEQFTEIKDMSKEETAVKSFIDTGNYALNYACSKKLRGGIPVGRISSFWGRSGTGKSLLMAGLCKDQQIDRVFVLSGEGGGITEELFDFIGAPKEKVRYIPVSTTGNYRINKENGKIEEVADKDMPDKLDTPTYIYKRGAILLIKMILNQLEYSGNKTKVLILLDSISILKSVRAFSGTQDMGATQKGFNDLFSAIDNAIEKTNAIFVFSNKVYSNFGDEYNPFKQAGGESVIYNPSLSIKLTALSDSDDISDSEMKDEKLRRKSALGSSLQVVRATVSKSRFGTLNRNATFIINQTYGVVKNSGLLEMLLDFGVAQKTGTRYIIPGVIDDAFFKKDFLSIFGKNETEYIDKLQIKLNEAEEKIRKQQQNLDVNDIQEAMAAEGKETGDEEIDLGTMAKEMEVDQEP
jgi:RecA/RadA recombinase